jgi:TPR repeat protein
MSTEEIKSFEKIKSQAENGNMVSQYWLGLKYFTGSGTTKDYVQAVVWYRKSAEAGFSTALDTLGECYEYGYGVEKNPAEAFKWYRMAAEKGDTSSFYNLGKCYFKGLGVAQDYEQAAAWFRRAAVQGNATAQRCLGDCYLNGLGVTQSKSAAQLWYYQSFLYFRQLEERGGIAAAPARYMMGMHFEDGLGVPKDEVEAYSYYLLAETSDDRARESIVRLNKVLTPGQITTAQNRSKELLKRSEAGAGQTPSGK